MSPLRLRLRFTKTGRVRFIGHLDLVRVWERAVRRAGLPLEFTAGFSPRPRMHFGLALPTTFASTAEYLDVDLSEDADPAATAAELNLVLPGGIDVVAAAEVDPAAESLQAAVTVSEYLVVACLTPQQWRQRVDGVLAAATLDFELERKGRTRVIDLRPGVLAARLAEPDEVAVLGERAADESTAWMRLAAQPRSFRPTEICAVMSPPVDVRLVQRTAQLVGGPTDFTEPLPAAPMPPGQDQQSRPIEERSGDGTLREEATPDPPATAVAPRP